MSENNVRNNLNRKPDIEHELSEEDLEKVTGGVYIGLLQPGIFKKFSGAQNNPVQGAIPDVNGYSPKQ
ncbi:MAG: hypothetical protein HXX08_22240 [Chloroflexi bacterium]|uniref:Uncharacterized protein n=1 Tax=Candidatus Chlorohelix allophototropha TaxID=3003348 RepID=A0A8T7M8U6_9CHLR|nr:hypothetical protein [Chloroflexota bacterium]WJW68518.1 hypothetical protein OZ401_004132 [Chloroflexota bacterium L227-S17]